MQRQATMRTVVPAHREVFAHLLAAHALLAGATGIDFRNLHAGTLSLAAQDAAEAGPAGIRNRPAQPAIPDHALHVQALDSDEAKATDQLEGGLVMMLAPQVLDASVELGKPLDCFPSVF